jgi:hypothetical protein
VAIPASAQRQPRVGRAASPPPAPPQMTVPYPGATVTVDPQLYQLWYQQRFPQRYPQQRRLHDRGVSPGYYPQVQASYPVYPYYPSISGGVTDANGRPLYIENDPSPYQGGYGLGTPDLGGAPYVAGANGTMAVDFGNGDTRTVPSCAAQSAERAPNGQPRTIFYQPGSGGVILREGQRGRVLGTPPAGANVCYTTDRYGRMALDWE